VLKATEQPQGKEQLLFATDLYYACLGMSDCYEQKKDYDKALQYARLVRDRYHFPTFCGTCAEQSQNQVAERIQRLEALARQPK
jgi:hypothetical protein